MSFLPSIRIAFPIWVSYIHDHIGILEVNSAPATIVSSGVAQEIIGGISNGPSAAPDPGRRRVWPFTVVVFYCAGVFILLSRAIWGWRAMSRIVRAGKPVVREAMILPELRIIQVPLYESEMVAAPLTAGILFPWIILPVAWRKWPAHKFNAVLAHELSPVRRHDTIIAPLESGAGTGVQGLDVDFKNEIAKNLGIEVNRSEKSVPLKRHCTFFIFILSAKEAPYVLHSAFRGVSGSLSVFPGLFLKRRGREA